MATLQSTSRTARLDFRLNKNLKRMIEQAATVNGQSVSDFALTNLTKAARQTINQATTTQLSARDRDTFLRLIESDAKPNSALEKAAKRYKKRHA